MVDPDTVTNYWYVIGSVLTTGIAAFTTFLIGRWSWSRGLKTEFMAEQAVRKLLMNEKWKMRSFSEISRKIGGFEDDELRKLLVRSGAVRFYNATGEKELWGLLSRNKDVIE